MKISYNTITYNRLDRFWTRILVAKEYFDVVRVVDTGSNDGTKEFCEMHGLRWVPFDLKLNIMEAWNVALRDANANDETFFYYFDSDEWPTGEFMRNARQMALGSGNGDNYNIILTPCFELSLDLEICRPYEIHQEMLRKGQPAWYEKEKAVKLYPSIHCSGCAHPSFGGFDKRAGAYPYGYYHSKTIKENCESGMVFCFADIMSNMEMGVVREHFYDKEIKFLKNFFTNHNIFTIPQFREFINKGNVPQEFKDFIIGTRQGMSIRNIHEYNNSRIGFFIYYFFIKHPEERPNEFDGYFGNNVWFYDGDANL